MKTFINGLIASLLFSASLMAQSQVDYSAAPGDRAIFNSAGTAVAAGNAVWIGTFNVGFDPATADDDPAALLANWHPFGSTTIRTIIQPGRFSDSDSNLDPFFGNKKIYIWIFSTDFAAAPATNDFSNVNEYGLFSSTNSNWSFSADPVPNNTRQVTSDEVNEAFPGTVGGSQLFLSPFTPVPEPSTLALICLAVPALVLVLRKRRR
jgi:PEP-CTERM motif-containing protein